MIEVENVSFTYPAGVHALQDISVTIPEGDFVAIMGENGAGKTTLIKHFNGILKPDRGRVCVDGVDTKNASVAELSRTIGLVFQNPDHQLFSETVEEEIAFGLKNFGFDGDEVAHQIDWTLDLLNLTQYRKTSPFLLSGGERKRVALATVLAWNPKTLVIDEPTIGQDYRQKERLRQFFNELRDQGRTVIFVTHDVEFVADCDPRVLLMYQGQILADGPAKQVLTNPEVTAKASILLPQIAQLFHQLGDLGLPQEVLTVREAKGLLEGLLKRGEVHEGL
jgi:energy-coupling factor transport system ATP-binding protein